MKKLVLFILIIFFLGITINGFCYESQKSLATEAAYFDVATGHKYVKNSDHTYIEYTRKGGLFKTDVSNTQPHLNWNLSVKEITQDSYLVYKKYENNRPTFQVLPGSISHPPGYQSTQILLSTKQLLEKDLGINRSTADESNNFNEKKISATKAAYIDTATGHRYIKNANNTYTEYTRKGELFKKNVPNTQLHLNSNKYVKEISEDSYLIYKKYENNKPILQVVTSSASHPEKWQCITKF